MKNTPLKISTLCVTLIISSCSDGNKDKTKDLTQLVELQHKKEDQLDSLKKELFEYSKSKGEIQRKISDTEQQSRNEKSNLVREFRTPVDKSLNEDISKLIRSENDEMQIALQAFRKDPKVKEWSSRIDKKKEFHELNLKYTTPVKKKFQNQKEELISIAKKTVAQYKAKTEEQVTKKHAESLKILKQKLQDAEGKHAEKQMEYSEASKEFGELAKKIRKLKELKEAQQ